MPAQGHQKNSLLDRLPSLPENPSHPAQVSLRTFALALSLSLGPSLIPVVTSLATPRRSTILLKKILKRELSLTGFAFSLTLIVGGGATLKSLWDAIDAQDGTASSSWTSSTKRRISSSQRAFLSNLLTSSVGIFLLQAGRRRAQRRSSPTALRNLPSPTLDLTLLLFVRAMDVFIQSYVFKQSHREYQPQANHRLVPDPSLLRERLEREELQHLAEASQRREILRTRIDAALFWACSARIMWCFVYLPNRLPASYVKWINALASIDSRLLEVLRFLRKGEWTYSAGSEHQRQLLTGYAQGLSYPTSWGDPVYLPESGGEHATKIWSTLNNTTRGPVGGLPCELVHGGVGEFFGLEANCTANAGLRGLTALVKALAIYIPAHFLPILLTRPRILLRPHRILATSLGSLRSATFLSAFISIFWYSICFARTLVLPRIFPWISHDFFDGPYGCVMLASLMCGSSIWIESGRRRGEMALYVLPKAVRSCLPNRWLRSGRPGVLLTERLTFVLSMASLLTAATHHPDTLRGLSRWTLAFVMNGPNAGFWKRRKRQIDPSMPVTPAAPRTPVNVSFSD